MHLLKSKALIITVNRYNIIQNPESSFVKNEKIISTFIWSKYISKDIFPIKLKMKEFGLIFKKRITMNIIKNTDDINKFISALGSIFVLYSIPITKKKNKNNDSIKTNLLYCTTLN